MLKIQCIKYYCLLRGAYSVPSIESKYKSVRDTVHHISLVSRERLVAESEVAVVVDPLGGFKTPHPLGIWT